MFANPSPGTDTYNANTDLPQETNTTVSGDATFICEFGSNVQGHFTAPLLSFEISLPSEDGSSTTFTTDCREWEDCDDWSPEHATTRLSIRPINTVRLSNYVHYRYEVQLTNVLQEFNASQFSCSISTGSSIRVLQWKGTAELIVEPSPVELESLSVPPTSVLPTGGGNNVTLPGVSVPNRRSSGTIIAGTVVPVVIVLVLFTATSLLLAAFAKWRRRQRREKSYELAEGKCI